MTRQPGTLVGAVMGSNPDGSVSFFGWGTYDGEFPPTDDVLFLGQPWTSIKDELPHFVNPRITLDSGEVVWGCECWWGSIAEVEKMLSGKTVHNVSIVEVRKRLLEEIRTEKAK